MSQLFFVVFKAGSLCCSLFWDLNPLTANMSNNEIVLNDAILQYWSDAACYEHS